MQRKNDMKMEVSGILSSRSYILLNAVRGATPVLGHSAKGKMTDLITHSDSAVRLFCNKEFCHQHTN